MNIYLRFSSSQTFTSKAVCFGTRSWCSHVDLELSNGKLIGAVPSKGVIERDIPRGEDRVEVYRVSGANEGVYNIMYSQLGKKYDWFGVLGLAINRKWEDDNHWFCSELIAYSFLHSNIPLLNTSFDTWRVTPRDLLLSTKLERMR